jgi:hypothetical protein
MYTCEYHVGDSHQWSTMLSACSIRIDDRLERFFTDMGRSKKALKGVSKDIVECDILLRMCPSWFASEH